MNRKVFLNYSLLALLSFSSVGLTSCKRKKEVTLQAFQNIHLHVAKFGLSKEISSKDSEGNEIKKLDPNISSTFFSIENSKGEGLITNIQPFPFGTKLKDIKLSIIKAEELAKVELSLDGGKSFEEWKEKDNKVFDLSLAKQDLKLRLSYQVAQGSELFSYIYKVKFKTYKFDPATIFWSDLAKLNFDVLKDDLEFVSYKLKNDKMMLLTVDKANKKNKFYTLNVVNNTFDEVNYSALPNGAFVQELKNYDNEVFVLASDKQLYRLKDNTWIALGQDAETLLGVFAPRKEMAEPSLALAVKDGAKLSFAHYDVSTGVLDKGETFLSDLSDKNYITLSSYNSKVGSVLTLLAQGSLTYQTTNALAWALPNRDDKLINQKKGSFAFVKNGDLFYRFVVETDGLTIYTKKNLSEPWHKNSIVALTPSDGSLFNSQNFIDKPIALWVKEKNFYLYKGGVDAGLYKGELKKNAI